jgi:DNA-binding transcriptional MerR regulator
MPRTSGGAGRGTAAQGRLLSIGAVLGTLREEFPEVTISKIRFLEAEGLVEPQRTPSGYRKFAPKDVERLVYVLRVQRDHYLPLRVIREHLEALDRGERVPLPGPAEPSGAAPRPPGAGQAPGAAPEAGWPVPGPPEPPEPRLSGADLLAATGAGPEQLAEWESYGLVTPGSDGAYDAGTADIAKIIVDLGGYGLQPRHLRALKAAADREAGLVEQVVAPLRRHRNPQTRAHAEATARELASLSVRLHAAMVHSALRVKPR